MRYILGMTELDDAAIRILAGLSLPAASKLVGVSSPTLRLYECGPHHVKSNVKRDACALFYTRLREFLDGVPFVRLAGRSPLTSTSAQHAA